MPIRNDSQIAAAAQVVCHGAAVALRQLAAEASPEVARHLDRCAQAIEDAAHDEIRGGAQVVAGRRDEAEIIELPRRIRGAVALTGDAAMRAWHHRRVL